MTRRDALRVMEVVNREKREYYSNNPKERVKCFETWESATLKTRGGILMVVCTTALNQKEMCHIMLSGAKK